MPASSRRFTPKTLAALAALCLAGCLAPTPAPPVAPEPAPPPTVGARPAVDGTPAATPSPPAVVAGADELPPALRAPPEPPLPPSRHAIREVARLLARQLRVPVEAIVPAGVAEVDWPDTCLGLPAEGEICASMITPGFAVTVDVGGRRYEFRTDLAARRIRLASAPPAAIGDSLLVWRDARSFSMLVIGTGGIAFGPRGRPLIATGLPPGERTAELQRFLATYGSLQARTPAGEVSLLGLGDQRPTPLQARFLAEWCRVVFQEVAGGLDAPALGRALVVRRPEDPTGAHEMIVISRIGKAAAYVCRGDHATLRAEVALDQADVAQLLQWIDEFESFVWSTENPGGAPGSTLEFEGDGVDPATVQVRARMFAFVEAVERRLGRP
jgi:hypothetical protein